MRRHRRDIEILSEMNLTNLLDTAFVLLIAFIITSSSIRQGMQVDLPQVAPQTTRDLPQSTVEISIAKAEVAGTTDRIVVDDQRLTAQELKDLLSAKKMLDPKMSVIVSGDAASTLQTFFQVLSVLKELKIDNVGLPTAPTDLKADADKPAKTKSKARPESGTTL